MTQRSPLSPQTIRPLSWRHYSALTLLAIHAVFLMLVQTVVEASKALTPDGRSLVELTVTAMLGLGIIFFFLYSKWISPAKGNALIQVVNVALGTLLFTTFFPEQSLELSQWLGLILCCAGIFLMIQRGPSGFFLHASDASPDTQERTAKASLKRLGLGVAIGFALWAVWLDWSAFTAGWAGVQTVLSDRNNAFALFVFEVAATTLTPLAAKVAIDQALTTRCLVTVLSIAILGLSLYFYFFYSDHIQIHKSNAVLQSVNTLAGTLLVAGLYADERLNARQWAGAGLAALGIALTLKLFAGEADLFRPVSIG